MALLTNATMLTNLFNPQVVGDLIDKKLIDAINFSPLCRVDTTLVDRPGNTLTMPSYGYIGDAADVAEGADIGIGQLTETTVTATVKKAGKGVQLTDEAVLSGYGDPLNEAVKQLTLSLAAKMDNDVLAILEGIAGDMAYSGTAFTADDIADALVKFGEDIDGDKVLLVSPADYATLRKADDWCPASEVAAGLVIRGFVGEIHGCRVVVSNKLAGKNEAFIVKPGAVSLIMKRDTAVETDRDIVNKSTIMTADKHYVAYLYDASKAIKMSW